MNIAESRAFLCGFFTVDAASDTFQPQGWKQIVLSEGEREQIGDFYYGDFVEFFSRDVRTFELAVNARMNIEVSVGRQDFTVENIRMYFCPFGVVVYSIKVVHRDTEFDNLMAVLATLRNVCFYDPGVVGEFRDKVISPLCRVYGELRGEWKASCRRSFDGKEYEGYPFLIENGNKLKIFHILSATDYPKDRSKLDSTLYEAGTLTRLGSYNGDDFMSSSEDYFREVMCKSKISVFNNWRALALFDTFTILSGTMKDYLLDNWEKQYFGMIYLYSVFSKFYLFRINTLFRRKDSNLTALKDEFLQYERKYSFPRISYNFLPLEIMEHLNESLDIPKDKSELHQMIMQENQAREESSDKRMNSLLFFLTCLTIFSAVWDLGCLLDSMYPFELLVGSSMTGFRVVTSVLLLITLLFIVVNRIRRR